MSLRCFVRLVLCALIGVSAGRARADEGDPPADPAARARYDEAMAAYGRREFAAAVEAFAASYAIEPRPATLFAQAQATRLAGDCPAAVVLYRRFLETGPTPKQTEATNLALARCAEPIPAVTKPSPPPTPPAPPVVREAPAPAPRPPFWRDPYGSGLVLSGVAVAAVGAALVVSAHGRDGPPAPGETFDAYEQRREAVESRFVWGAVTIGAGAALALAGVGRWVWFARRGDVAVVGVGGRF